MALADIINKSSGSNMASNPLSQVMQVLRFKHQQAEFEYRKQEAGHRASRQLIEDKHRLDYQKTQQIDRELKHGNVDAALKNKYTQQGYEIEDSEMVNGLLSSITNAGSTAELMEVRSKFSTVRSKNQLEGLQDRFNETFDNLMSFERLKQEQSNTWHKKADDEFWSDMFNRQTPTQRGTLKGTLDDDGNPTDQTRALAERYDDINEHRKGTLKTLTALEKDAAGLTGDEQDDIFRAINRLRKSIGLGIDPFNASENDRFILQQKRDVMGLDVPGEQREKLNLFFHRNMAKKRLANLVQSQKAVIENDGLDYYEAQLKKFQIAAEEREPSGKRRSDKPFKPELR